MAQIKSNSLFPSITFQYNLSFFFFFDSLMLIFRIIIYDLDYTFGVEKNTFYLEEYRMLNNSCQTTISNYFAFFTYKISQYVT